LTHLGVGRLRRPIARRGDDGADRVLHARRRIRVQGDRDDDHGGSDATADQDLALAFLLFAHGSTPSCCSRCARSDPSNRSCLAGDHGPRPISVRAEGCRTPTLPAMAWGIFANRGPPSASSRRPSAPRCPLGAHPVPAPSAGRGAHQQDANRSADCHGERPAWPIRSRPRPTAQPRSRRSGRTRRR